MTGRKYLGLIPARGGSKRIPGKNVKALAGKPLIIYTIDAAIRSGLFWKVVVSTDDAAIAKIAQDAGAEVPFLRPAELARDESPTVDVVLHAIEQVSRSGTMPDAVVILQPTSPLRGHGDIACAVKLFESSKCDTLVSVSETPIKMDTIMKASEEGKFMRLSKPNGGKNGTRVRLNGAIYITGSKRLMDERTIFGERIVGYRMPSSKSVDIDTDDDWKMAEILVKRGD